MNEDQVALINTGLPLAIIGGLGALLPWVLTPQHAISAEGAGVGGAVRSGVDGVERAGLRVAGAGTAGGAVEGEDIAGGAVMGELAIMAPGRPGLDPGPRRRKREAPDRVRGAVALGAGRGWRVGSLPYGGDAWND